MGAPPRKPAVLVVDDRNANLLAFEALLAEEYEVVSVTSGEAAIAAVRGRPDFAAVLMDVQMPGMDGFQAATAIKQLETGKDLPIIFVTAVHKEDPHVKLGYQSGGIDYFGKPFDPEILRLKLRIYAAFRTREAVLRQRERQVRESEKLLRVGRKLSSVLESLSVGVLIADVDGRICQTTEEVSRIFKAELPPGKDAYGEILGWWDGAGRMIREAGGPLARALSEGAASHSEATEVICLDGTRKTILISALPLRGLDEKLVGAVVLVQDMTEPREISHALEDQVSRLIGAGIELEQSASATQPG